MRTVLTILLILGVTGCTNGFANRGRMTTYAAPESEVQWIRNGEPIEFESELWYPQDRVDILKDTEVLRLGKYKGVEFFVDKVDVRPYNRLYTKLGDNTFRVFLKRNND